LNRLQQEIAQLNKHQVQAQFSHEMKQYVQALRQRAQRLNGLQAVASRQWPAALQVQEWRVEGATWRLQGLADSGADVQEFLKLLAPLGPWQESPALLELTATPVAPGLNPRALRYVMQARWRELGVMPSAMTAPAPTSPQGPRSAQALSIR
jgi:Tfp pilus assembly protein PilN